MAWQIELSGPGRPRTQQARPAAKQAHPEVPSRTRRPTGQPAQHRTSLARFATRRVLEIPRWRLPAHLQDRGQTTAHSGSSCRPPQRSLPLAPGHRERPRQNPPTTPSPEFTRRPVSGRPQPPRISRLRRLPFTLSLEVFTLIAAALPSTILVA